MADRAGADHRAAGLAPAGDRRCRALGVEGHLDDAKAAAQQGLHGRIDGCGRQPAQDRHGALAADSGCDLGSAEAFGHSCDVDCHGHILRPRMALGWAPVRSLGIDVGATNVKWAAVETDGGTVLARGREPTAAQRGPEAVLARLGELARTVAETHRVERIGLALPGPLDLERGRTVFLPNMPGWRDIPVAEGLAAAAGLPVALLNDARAFTLAEHRLGAGRGARTMVGITLGTGVGGGVIAEGRLLLGLNGTAGEIGHQTLEPGGLPCPCGNTGCLEQYASGPAIARAAGAATAEAVTIAAREGDPNALAALEQAGTYLGLGIANVALAVGPEAVVVGGGVSAAGDLILQPACRELRRRVTVMPVERIHLVRAELGDHAGALGAALWASARE
jgi:glucokinase